MIKVQRERGPGLTIKVTPKADTLHLNHQGSLAYPLVNPSII